VAGARAAIAAGLLAALAAALAPLGPASGAPGASLTVRVPSAVQMAVVALLALSALLAWPYLGRPGRAATLGGLALALLFTAPVYFAAVVGPVLGQFQPSGAESAGLLARLAARWQPRDFGLNLAILGVLQGFEPPLLALAPPALARLLAGRLNHPSQRRVLAAWIAVCLAFLFVDLTLRLVTRYVYFAAPLICLAIGALLARQWRWRAGRFLVVALVLWIAWAGTTSWVEGVLMRVSPSVVALTH